jgi:uncharacterized protein YjdB
MKKFSRLIFFILVLVSVLTLNTTKCLAATVGDQLTLPESGWQRYDDSNPLIVYSNFDYPRSSGSGRYNNTLSYSNNLQSKVSFAFYGTKLRIIGEPAAAAWRSTVKITIDGTSYYYSEISQTGGKQRLEFEINDLQKKIHNVTIEKISIDLNTSLTLDAIDIDADGTLLNSKYPIHLKATSDKKIDLTWSSVAGITNYIVKRSTVSGTGYQAIASLSQNSYTDTDVTNGTTYYYVVSAIVSGTESADSNEVSVALENAVVSAPTNLIATVDNYNKKIDVSWNIVSGSAINYNVYRSETSGAEYTKIGSTSTTSYQDSDTSLTYGKTYYYVVTAIDSEVESDYSDEASATLTEPATNLKLVLEINEFKQLSVTDDLSDNAELTWTSSDASVATVDANGKVKALKSGNTVITVTSEDKSYTDTIKVLVVDLDLQLSVDLFIGETCRLTVDDLLDTVKVTWTSYDPTIATISSKGKVAAVGKGLTYITATDDQGKEIGKIYIRVRQ